MRIAWLPKSQAVIEDYSLLDDPMSTHEVALITGQRKRRVGNCRWQRALADRGHNIALHYNRSAEEAQQTVAQLEQKGVRAAAVSGRRGPRRPMSLDCSTKHWRPSGGSTCW